MAIPVLSEPVTLTGMRPDVTNSDDATPASDTRILPCRRLNTATPAGAVEPLSAWIRPYPTSVAGKLPRVVELTPPLLFKLNGTPQGAVGRLAKNPRASCWRV